ncbi:UDP-N-acetylglucosamine--N-acetylmuramyl-(pentapeptide) pyrophosphoryl-undecaprenol N-acetylglucosamine transferase [Sulfurovum sp. ST-21]|uniref:UDP-N-acetylglucosamine--N-acetylmuramyl-(pentapeptide) pyrophosphoryl-undecaprenol N-acetylglucosamine transferase n=1 Tax=Sulfurovum indicum TaxID=2779528 RepID=A0A7M1S4G2_9BACT|nr:UDP-N-acetylglucosamine--N-acetylmuramyl-(pentapeptide) pyrophosphoryl-undecaprenol N-acetylglucosamine transferase [Sulfurovum indicum]QOR61619.1 UDP-N-acetylglucosamine--N-acetylmuramyl-(pentapeptide) pyrophosphoryl-undecaprenol N-acetylglucosamine transferase [Sulfurovum indicum]
MSIVMTGGGTGGHLAIVRAVKEQLVNNADKRDQGAELRAYKEVSQSDTSQNSSPFTLHSSLPTKLVYIGSTKGQDRQWFEDDVDFEAKYFLKTKGVVNQRGIGKLQALWMMFKAFLEARKLLKKHHAKVVFSVGGFSAAATAFAAKSLGIPLVIHEQNAAQGSLNRLLKPFSAAFISSYLEESPIKAYPVKEVFFQNAHIRKKANTVIFLGGSQGARAINELALSIAPELKERGIKIIHQAGSNHIEEVENTYKELGIEAEVFGFTTKLADYMNEADFAIARAGASTLWELSAAALPTLFVPYPYAAGDHQYHNAKFLVDKELAWLMKENEIGKEKVLALLDENLEIKSRGLMEIVEKDGSREIALFLKAFTDK